MTKPFYKKSFLTALVIAVFISAFYFAWLAPRYTVPILSYHRFSDSQKNSIFVTPKNFARQMKYLKQKGYDVISLDNLIEGITAKKRFKRNTVVITADDGFEDFYTHAFAVLKEHNFPAAMFIIPAHIGKQQYLNWEQVRQMQDAGITIGAHTKNDVYLPSVKDKDALWDETAGAKGLIEEKTGRAVYYFCYPLGGFNEEDKQALKSVGYKAACTTNRGMDRFNRDLFELKRAKITDADMNKPLSFKAKLSGYYNLFRSAKPGCEKEHR